MAKKPPPPPIKKVGSEKHLAHLTYSQIAAWAGLAPRSVIQYASRKEFDPKDIVSVLQWVNGRRVAKGLPLIGAPATSEPPTPAENSPENSEPPQDGQVPSISEEGDSIQKHRKNGLETDSSDSHLPSVQQPYLNTPTPPVPPASYNPATGDFEDA